MQLKKRITAVVTVAAMTVLAVLSSNLEMRSKDSTGTEDFWYHQKETMYLWYSDETLTNYLNSAAVTFGEKENVRVIPMLGDENSYLEDINQFSIANDMLAVPDAFLIGNDSLEKAYLAGLAEEIQDPYGICNEEHFAKSAISAVSYAGKKVAYPFSYETAVLVYNKDYLALWQEQQRKQAEAAAEASDEAPEEILDDEELSETENAAAEMISEEGVPETLEGILHIANTFDVPEGVEGVMEWDVSDLFFNYWFVGQYMVIGQDAGDDRAHIDINNEQTIQCLEAYQNLNQFFSITSDTVTYDSCIDAFLNGKLVFTMGNTQLVQVLEEAKENGAIQFDYGYSVMPKVSNDLDSRSLSVTQAVAVNGYSEHKELANRFASFLTDEYAKELYERTGKVSANRTAEQENPVLQVYFEEYEKSVPLPKMMEIGNLWLQLEALFAKVWNGAQITELVDALEQQIATQVNVK